MATNAAACRRLLCVAPLVPAGGVDTLLTAFGMLADDRPINVRPWLYRIARNRSLNHLRRTQAVGVDSMDVHLSEGGLTTADKVHLREEFRLLIADVQELPETQRTALLLRNRRPRSGPVETRESRSRVVSTGGAARRCSTGW